VALDKPKLQLMIVILIMALWTIGILVAVLDGSTMLKAVTPMMTLVFGWLFTAKVTEG
jgi:hypothetical protein